MAADPSAALADLIHDVNSKCASLRGGIAQLRGEASTRELDLLRLMGEQARALAESIAAYEAALRDGGR